MECRKNFGIPKFSILRQRLSGHGHENGPKSHELCMDLDEKRIQKAERSLSEGAKQARIDLKTIRKTKQEQEIDEEGQLYGAGIARLEVKN
ncbi:PREDICTED: uncharacterized protein LOC105144187 [Acromyrmex echinatior]|uniref:uncharacterized protein LOC105144187 n=1 Tax=Acromyrmex echinatior TaxID=103372 RepID=UPI000580C8DE|nr:PREDICTED: uncharacterized protein LOC105144187 [Acromyrmex echinatior]